MLSADNLCKQLGPSSVPNLVGPDLDPNCLTQMVFLEEFFELDDFGEKTPQKQCKKKNKKKKTKKNQTFIINQSANSYIEA